MQRSNQYVKMIITAVLLAVGMVLPLLLGQIQILGQALSPLHIPALICGLTCGWGYGAVLGFVLPILRSLIFGMPPMFPGAVSMAFELCGYGLLTGLLYPTLCRKLKGTHFAALMISMVIAMVAGRIVGGAAKAILLGMNGGSLTFNAFVSSYFISTSVGAVLHLIIVPAIVIALEKAKLSPLGKEIAA